MQKLIISSEAHDAHECYSCCIKTILEHIASGKELFLSSQEESPVKLNKDELKYFSKLLDLYNTMDFLLAEPQNLKTLIKEEKDICSIIGWKERTDNVNNILKSIFGYDEGFSKGKFIHLKEYNGKYIIQHSRRPPDGGTEWGAVEFIESLNVDYCVYCNEASLYYEDGNGKRSYSHSSLDHFYNKSSYPFLALTLTNLIPSCTQCNSSIKSTRELPENALNPYEGSFHESVQFHLTSDQDKNSIILKIISKTLTVDQLSLDEIQGNPLGKKAKTISDFFQILDRYKKYFSDTINKYIYNIYSYNHFHIEVINNMLKDNITKEKMFPEFFYDELDINKYRFEKLIIDLCKEAGIRD
ncbi:MAG: hypothetical protein K6G44_15970 [Lentisphaeria bacterium]|nr:hypothetical protein [Lentisphaeria bacterium]